MNAGSKKLTMPVILASFLPEVGVVWTSGAKIFRGIQMSGKVKKQDELKLLSFKHRREESLPSAIIILYLP
jgi:hypothetical protein